jgi:alkylation response protein AidB-like acyl-CoA dehydrogenase
MDFELDEEQVALQEAVRDVAGRECPSSLLRSVIDGGDDAAGLWKVYVGLDWPALTIPEADGGIGLGAVELAVTLEELGYVADPSPFLATVSQYLPMVRALSPGTRRELLDAVRAGGTGAVAYAAGTVRARRDGVDWVLDGTARFVLDGDRADEVAVVAATGEGPGVFVVPGPSAGAARARAFDLTLHLATLRLDGVAVRAERAAVGADVEGAIVHATEEAVTGLSAMTVGACRRVLDLVLDHVKQRHQFGVPIGSFQAVKHLAVDMYVAIERARALYQFAALTIAEDDERRTVAASMAKAAAGDCQHLVFRHGIQLFGGLGFTWENDLQLYARRAKAGELLLGGAIEHRARVARWAQRKGVADGIPPEAAWNTGVVA